MDKQSFRCLAKVITLGVVLGTALAVTQPASAELKSNFAKKTPAVTAWGEGAIANDYLATVAKQTAAPAVKKETLDEKKKVLFAKKPAPVVKKEVPAVKKETPVVKKAVAPVKEAVKEEAKVRAAENAKLSEKLNGLNAENAKLSGNVQSLSAENAKLADKLNGLNADNAKLSEKVKTVNAENAKLSGNMQKLIEDNAKLAEKVAALNLEIKDLKLAVAQQNVQMVKMMNKQDIKFNEMKLEQDGKIVNLMHTVEQAMKK